MPTNEKEIEYIDYSDTKEVLEVYRLKQVGEIEKDGKTLVLWDINDTPFTLKFFAKKSDNPHLVITKPIIVDGRRDCKPVIFTKAVKNRMAIIKDPEMKINPSIRFGSYEELYDAIMNYIKLRIKLDNEEEYYILTSFVVYSWFWDLLDVATYLEFLGDYGSGKTRALETLSNLCYRSLMSASISLAGIPRAIQNYHTILFIDEFIGSEEEKRELVKILNAGYRRGSVYVRVAPDKSKIEEFDVFGPKVVATSEDIEKSLQTRLIVIRLTKKKVVPVLEDLLTRIFLIDHLTRLRINYYTLNHKEFTTKIMEKLVVEAGFDSREAEIISNIIYFTPAKYVGALYKLLREKYIRKEEEFSTSLEARVVNIIKDFLGYDEKEKKYKPKTDVVEQQGSMFIIKVIDIVSRYLEEEGLVGSFGTPLQLRHSISTRIGIVLKKLGFGKKHTEKGNIIYFFPEQFEKIVELYLKASETLEKEIKTELDLTPYLFETQIKNNFNLLLDDEKEQIQKPQ
jgi:hypothetical protein